MTLMQSSLLQGDHTIPGCEVPKEIREKIPEILQACRDFGLDFYPTVVEFLTYDEMSEIASYGGFPVRYPHWRWGMEYEEMSKGYEHGYHRIYEIVINCVGLATNLLTRAGRKKASDVSVGDYVMGASGWRKVIAVKPQKSSKVRQLKFHNFGQDIICTPNHKWMCVRDGNKIWVEAKDMKLGELVLAGGEYSNFLGKPADISWSPDKVIENTRPNIRARLLPINPPTKMTLELAELMGILTGDGSCGVRLAGSILSVYINKLSIAYQKHVAKLMANVFGREPAIYEKQNITTVTLCSKFAVDFFDACGWSKGSTYKTKIVPQSIWASSNEFRAAFIRGLFDTDGHCSRSLSMSSFTDELVADVQLLLLEMGIRSQVRRVKNNHNDIAVLYINGKSNIRKFAKYIGFNLEYKNKALETLAAKDGRSGRSHAMPGIMEEIVKRIKSVDNPPDWLYRYGRRSITNCAHVNSLYGFLYEAVNKGYEELLGDLLKITEQPAYVLESNIELPDSQETIDIALDHDDHDFLANGFLSHNTSPCYIYCLNSNTFVDNVTVIAHATGHNHFFKNNIYFSPTSQNMLNELANHGSRIRRHMSEWGNDKVQRFIDKILSIETLIDPAKAWEKKKYKERVIWERRKVQQPRRLRVDHDYMDDWINTKEWLNQEQERIRREELSEMVGIMGQPEKDIFGWLKNHAPLNNWKQDVMAMLYDEAIYFSPQGMTKVANEGFASLCDSQIMARYGMAQDDGIVEYALHKAGVLGGKRSTNPYKLGYSLLLWIEERWNKGKFGKEWDDCKDARERENWDKKLGLGMEKVFEVCKYYNDVNLIAEFFDQEFCDKYEFFQWRENPDGSREIATRDAETIKKSLIKSRLNRGLPEIKLVEHNFRGKRIFCMEHTWEGRTLHPGMTADTMQSISYIWDGPVALITKDEEGREFAYYCEDSSAKVVATTVDKI